MASLLHVFMHVMHMLLCLTATLMCGYREETEASKRK